MNAATVVKIGGNIIDDAAALDAFLRDFAAVEGPRLLVHGGGKIATDIGRRLGVESAMIDGRRVTDAATLDIVTMVYGGLVNKTIVAALQARGCNALGLTGADANIIRARRRPAHPVDYGFAGDIEQINDGVLTVLLQAGFVPVVAPLTHDGAGTILNTNADTIASSIATALAPHMEVDLVYCFEKRGVLADAGDDTSFLPVLPAALYEQLKQRQVVTGGMLPKIDNAFAALHNGVRRVYIAHAQYFRAALAGEQCATVLVPSP